MLATLIQNNTSINESVTASHVLVLLPKLEKLPNKYDLLGEDVVNDADFYADIIRVKQMIGK